MDRRRHDLRLPLPLPYALEKTSTRPRPDSSRTPAWTSCSSGRPPPPGPSPATQLGQPTPSTPPERLRLSACPPTVPSTSPSTSTRARSGSRPTLPASASVLPADRVGAYGGYHVIRGLFDQGLIQWGWQTSAWSKVSGKLHWDPRAHLQQYRHDCSGGGLTQADVNRAMFRSCKPLVDLEEFELRLVKKGG